MINFLDSFLSYWSYWMFCSFALGIIGLIYFHFIKGHRINSINPFTILISQLFITWLIAFGGQWIVLNYAKNEVLSFLNKNNIKIKINGSGLDKEQTILIIDDFRNLKNKLGHNSHPEKQIEIELISSNEKILLKVRQDSEIKNEFWVFWDKYKSCQNNNFGKIYSTLLFNLDS